MPQELTSLAMGYSGYVTIDESYYSLLTSYSLTRNFNVMKSNSVGKFVSGSSNRWNKLSNDVIFDYPIHQLSLGLQVTETALKYLIGQMVANGFQDPISIDFIDDSIDATFCFDKVFITNFSFNVSNNSIATVSLSGKILQKQFDFQIGKHTLNPDSTNSGVSSLTGNILMPYWNFEFNYAPFNSDVKAIDFSINFNHNFTPKFICGAFEQSQPPFKIIYSVPSLTFQCNYVMYQETSQNYRNSTNGGCYYSSQSYQIPSSGNGKQYLEIRYGSSTLLFLTNCVINNIVNNVGQMNSVNTFTISGQVYGKISSSSE